MDAVKFLEERERMCLIYKACDGCPLQGNALCPDEGKNAEAIVKTVEKWSAEHPQKTRLQDFLEKYPNAVLTSGERKVPAVSPAVLGYCKRSCCDCPQGNKGLSACWGLPLEG